MINNKYVSPVNVVYLPVIEERSIFYEGGGDELCIKGTSYEGEGL